MPKTISNKLIRLWDEYFAVIADGLSKAHVGLISLSFVLIVYVGYQLAGESELIKSPLKLVYYLTVVGSTVGFGDLSPVTDTGKTFTAFFVIPGALGIFAMIAGKIVARGMNLWFRKQKGMHTLSLTNHIVLIGYNPNRTPSLVKLIDREDDRDIVLVSCEQKENPLPDMVQFINVPSFTNEDELSRSSLKDADCIIIDTDNDENTLLIALFVSAINSEAHLVAHFLDTVKARILKHQCPNAEIISNLSTELLAKSVVDSGSSLLHTEMVNAEQGETQYGIKVESTIPFEIKDVFLEFKVRAGATIIGMRRHGEDKVSLNPDLSTMVYPGDTLYYISDERIEFNHWPTA